jgi:hypothetical protein
MYGLLACGVSMPKWERMQPSILKMYRCQKRNGSVPCDLQFHFMIPSRFHSTTHSEQLWGPLSYPVGTAKV